MTASAPLASPSTYRRVSFATLEEKARWLDASASLDAHMLPVRRLADRLATEALTPMDFLHSVHQYVRDRIKYVRDTKAMPAWRPTPFGEELADSVIVLTRGWDDCDGKSRLLCALVRGQTRHRVDARIRPVFKGPAFVHVQSDVRAYVPQIGISRRVGIATTPWILAETCIRGCELGQDPRSVPKRPDGSWDYTT